MDFGGLPGDGKTSLGVSYSLSAAAVSEAIRKANAPACVFSQEMKDERIARRILAGYTPARASGSRDAKYLSEVKWREVIKGAAQLGELPLYVDDTCGLTIPMLRAKVRRYQKEFGMKFAVLDYVGLMDAAGRDETQRGTAIAKGLQRIAHDEGIALLALSQLRRPQNKNPNERATKEWLRWSGDYEANADVVLLIHRPKDLQTSTYTKRDWIIVGKARDGAVGAIPVIYDEDRLMFFGRKREDGE